MTESSQDTKDTPERIGHVLSIIFLLALAALFIYGYAGRIISTVHI